MLFLNTSLSLTSFKLSRYKPYINYDWSATTTSGLRYLKDVGSTPTYNASMYFGRGAYLNGVDQKVDYGTLPTSSPEVSMTITGKSIVCNHKYNFWIKQDGFAYYLADGVTLVFENITYNIANTYTFNITPTLIEVFENGVKILTRIPKSILSGGDKTIGVRKTSFYASVIKDVYMFNRVLSQSEITQSYEQPEAFYAMAQADSTCVLNMPMCETSSTVRNYKTGIDHPVTNYTSSVRDNAKNLQYGLQTCKFVRDSLGVIQSASDYLECDGVGYGNTGWIPDINKDETLEIIFDSSKDAIELNGCEFPKGFGVGSYEGTPNRAYVKVHGSATKTFSTLTAISLLTIPYNATTHTFDIYSNEVLLYENIAITAIDNTIKTFKIGNRDGILPVTTPIRLFKVHNKVLTQEEITANYNSYVAKGLLS